MNYEQDPFGGLGDFDIKPEDAEMFVTYEQLALEAVEFWWWQVCWECAA